jgi:hypothetical protein
MRHLVAFTILVFLATQVSSQQPNQKQEVTQPQNGGGAIIYSKGGAFLIEGPSGWTTDHEVDKRQASAVFSILKVAPGITLKP